MSAQTVQTPSSPGLSSSMWYLVRGSQAAYMLNSVWSVSPPRPARFSTHQRRKGDRHTGNCCRCDGCSRRVKAHPWHRHLVNHIGHQLPATKEQVDGTLTVTQDTDAKEKLRLALIHTNTPDPHAEPSPKRNVSQHNLFLCSTCLLVRGSERSNACACQAAPAGAGQRKEHACPCQAAPPDVGQRKEHACAC